MPWLGAQGVPGGASESVHPLERRSEGAVALPYRDADAERLQAGAQRLALKPPELVGARLSAADGPGEM